MIQGELFAGWLAWERVPVETRDLPVSDEMRQCLRAIPAGFELHPILLPSGDGRGYTRWWHATRGYWDCDSPLRPRWLTETVRALERRGALVRWRAKRRMFDWRVVTVEKYTHARSGA